MAPNTQEALVQPQDLEDVCPPSPIPVRMQEPVCPGAPRKVYVKPACRSLLSDFESEIID